MTLLKKRWWKENWDTVVAIVGVIVVVVALCFVWLILYLSLEQEVAMTTAIGTIALALATAVYAWHTRRLAQEMKEQRYDTARPIIDIQRYASPERAVSALGEEMTAREGKLPSGLLCILHSIGLGPAIDVYSFVRMATGVRCRYDFGTLAVGEHTNKEMNIHFHASLRKRRERMKMRSRRLVQ